MAENHPGRLPLADEGQSRARRQAHSRRSALHPHQRGRRHLRAGPRRLGHRLPRRPHQLRHQQRAMEQRPVLPDIRRELHQRRDDHQRGLQGHRRSGRSLLRADGIQGRRAEWPFNGFVGQYDDASWQYAGTKVGDQGRAAATAQSGEKPRGGSGHGAQRQAARPAGPPFDAARRVAASSRRR